MSSRLVVWPTFKFYPKLTAFTTTPIASLTQSPCLTWTTRTASYFYTCSCPRRVSFPYKYATVHNKLTLKDQCREKKWLAQLLSKEVQDKITVKYHYITAMGLLHREKSVPSISSIGATGTHNGNLFVSYMFCFVLFSLL